MRTSICLVVFFLLGSGIYAGPQLQDYDIIFQTSRSAQSAAIQKATNSRFSHMGLICFLYGKPYVFEAVSPVKYTPLNEWITRGENASFEVKRLKNADSVITSQTRETLQQALKRYENKPYDITFEWSDDKIYCSELVWKVYRDGLSIELSKLQKLSDFDLTDDAVKVKLKERYGADIPLDEPVVSPVSIYNSDFLESVPMPASTHTEQ